MYCLLANAISGAKLVKMFEEAKFRCVKVQFFLGLLFNFFWIFIIFCGEKRLKLICFGMYRRMSLWVFSTHPFCHEEYVSAMLAEIYPDLSGRGDIYINYRHSGRGVAVASINSPARTHL